MVTIVSVLVALAIGFVLGRLQKRYSFQNAGEERLRGLINKHCCAPDYHLLNHVTIRLADGTTQIDHILVSRFGVFVIETKDYRGWIFANPRHGSWTQVLFQRKFRFQNPIFQNHRHLLAVQALLDFLPPESVKSAVVFTGSAEFKAAAPTGVFTLSEFLDHIRSQTHELMSINRVQFCVGRLETARLAITKATDVEHVESLAHRHRR
ncbi:MAG: NERD domain-containing protein [Burkholderiales bacterium]|nr:NERD domain-containing protein [Burkholderiales bacterium]